MTYAYTTTALIQAELRATSNFSSTSLPTADQVTTWIAEESAAINDKSGRNWGSTAYSETLDYNGEEILTLTNAPVVSVTSLLYSTAPLGTDTYSLSDTKTEGTHYTTYLEDGEIAILPNWSPSIGRKRIQVNYTAGYATTPLQIQKLATKKLAKRVVDTIIQKDINEKKSGKSVSVGSISIVKPADFGVAQYKTLQDEIKGLEEALINGTTAYRIGGHRY